MATLNLKMRFVDGRTDTVAVAADATVAQLKTDMAPKVRARWGALSPRARGEPNVD